jgi:copper transport protein
MAFLALAWPAGGGVQAIRRLLWAAWTGLVVTTTAGFGIQGAAAGGLGVRAIVRPSVVSGVLDTRFGRLSALRLAFLLLGAFAAVRFRRRGVVLAVSAVAVVATVALSGHAGSGRWVGAAVVADVVHLLAISVWLGGLVILAGYVLRPAVVGGDAEPVARTFSTVAVSSVALIVATGEFQAVRQVGEPSALVDTSYGRLLLVKVALVAAMVALGARNRSWLRRRSVGASAPAFAAGSGTSLGPGAAPASPPSELRDLRRWVGTEAVVAAGVLVVAGLLVGAVPARTAFGRPFSAELDARRVLIDLTVDPAKAGPADVHVYTLSRSGQVTEAENIEADLRLPARDVGPLRVPLRRAGPGHFAAYGVSIPLPGRWELTLTAEFPDGSERVTATVPVR